MSWIAIDSCGRSPTTKKELEIRVEQSTDEIEKPIEKLEQYATPSSIAAAIVWEMRNKLRNDTVIDLGCGTGRILVAGLLAGADYGVGVEIDHRLARRCLESIRKTCTWNRGDVIRGDVSRLPLREANAIVIMNPPFGTRIRGLDRSFFESAFQLARIIVAIHYDDDRVRRFLSRLSSRKGFRLLGGTRYKMMLKQALVHHRSRHKYIPVVAYVFCKEDVEGRWVKTGEGDNSGRRRKDG